MRTNCGSHGIIQRYRWRIHALANNYHLLPVANLTKKTNDGNAEKRRALLTAAQGILSGQ
jgi:hypothetical protein